MQYNMPSTEEPSLPRKTGDCHRSYESLYELKLHPASLANKTALLCYVQPQAVCLVCFCMLVYKVWEFKVKEGYICHHCSLK